MRTFANAQAVLITYLRPELADVAGLQIGTTVPTSRTAGSPPLIVVRRVGGPAVPPVIDRPRLDFMCWESSEFRASALASRVRALVLFDLPGQVIDGHTVYRPSEFSGPTAFPDPAGSAVPVVIVTLEFRIRVKESA